MYITISRIYSRYYDNTSALFFFWSNARALAHPTAVSLGLEHQKQTRKKESQSQRLVAISALSALLF